MSHLPKPILSKDEYEKLYEFNMGADDGEHPDEWQEIPIPKEATAEQVYRSLPSALDFEYGGYITKSKIRFVPCSQFSTDTIQSEPCTFHSHPTSIPNTEPDLPSAQDIYAFLKWRHLRAITVGRNLIWSFNKSQQTIATIQRLKEWEQGNLLEAMKQLTKTSPSAFAFEYPKLVLCELGVDWPNANALPTNFKESWVELLESALNFEVNTFVRTVD